MEALREDVRDVDSKDKDIKDKLDIFMMSYGLTPMLSYFQTWLVWSEKVMSRFYSHIYLFLIYTSTYSDCEIVQTRIDKRTGSGRNFFEDT